MYSQKFSQFEIGQPLLMSYNDGSFYILQKKSKSSCVIVCLDKKENPILKDFEVGMVLNKIPANSFFGKILNK